MKCLQCGRRLAIFRKLSLGNFCCLEHRARFAKDQSDRGLARLTADGKPSAHRPGSNRVFPQFFAEPLAAVNPAAPSYGYFETVDSRFEVVGPSIGSPGSAGPWPKSLPIYMAASESPSSSPVTFRIPEPTLPGIALPVLPEAPRTRLRTAGLILPWSNGANGSFSLAPLVAAVWAQPGASSPIVTAVDFQPMNEPVLPAILSNPLEEAPPKPPVETPPVMRSRKRPRPPQPRRSSVRRASEELFDYREPLAPGTMASSPEDPWYPRMVFSMPSAPVVFGLFSVLFLFAAATVFLAAPKSLSRSSYGWKWESLRAAIRGRAVLKLEDDFRAGLGAWQGPSGWSQDWTFDQAGFLRPGRLGFWRTSMTMKNYRLEFLGQIERKSLGWVFRAQDENNYYAAKLTIVKPGPLPMVDLIHYAVTNGKEGPRIRVPLPFAVRTDTLYQVQVNIQGSQYRTTVNGRIVDSWSDLRLMAGGVGFVADRGEAARVRWVRVSDKDDVLGRICSYLSAKAPVSDFPEVLSATHYSILRQPGL